ncbi:MAG TPA: XrtA/PEP-CTERM system histidine kinase PrsK, partial [Nitrospirota bacterium]
MIGTILSSIAAVSLLAIGAYVVAKQRTTANMLFVIVAVLLAGIELADQFSLHTAGALDVFKRISLCLEALLPAAFMSFSLAYGRALSPDRRSKVRLGALTALGLIPLVILLVAAGDDLYYSPDLLNEQILFLGGAGYWFYVAIMALLIVALVNIETTFVATRGMARNRMKFEAFGIMTLLAVLIFYYSQGLLYRTINMNLLPVRSSVLIIVSLMIGYSRAARGSGAPVMVSRYVLFRSITLLIVGLYLLGLGFIGEGMRYFGVEFGRNLTIVIAFAGGIFLLAVLFSDNMRRRAKVFVNKHFYATKHDYRDEWIKFTNRLSSCGTLVEVQEAVLTVYRETFGLAGVSLYLLSRDEKRYIRASEQFMADGSAELFLPDGLNDYFTKRERVLDVAGSEYSLSTDEKAVFGRGKTRLIVPLISGGRVEGLIGLREQIVPEALTYDDYDLMKVMARQAAQAIMNLRLSEEIMEMRAMAAVSRISTFVIHDLKNLTSGLSLVVDNAAEHISNPDFQQDAIRTVKNTLAKMKNLIQRL